MLKRKFLAIMMGFVPTICIANSRIISEDWIVDITSESVESYTVSGTDTSFGIFCAGGQCFSYIRQPLNCQEGARTAILLNAGVKSLGLSTTCLRINNHTFQTIDQFNDIFDVLLKAKFLSFAVPIDDGRFAISYFTMRGAQSAIDKAFQVAAVLAKQKNANSNFQNAPGVRNSNQFNHKI